MKNIIINFFLPCFFICFTTNIYADIIRYGVEYKHIDPDNNTTMIFSKNRVIWGNRGYEYNIEGNLIFIRSSWGEFIFRIVNSNAVIEMGGENAFVILNDEDFNRSDEYRESLIGTWRVVEKYVSADAFQFSPNGKIAISFFGNFTYDLDLTYVLSPNVIRVFITHSQYRTTPETSVWSQYFYEFQNGKLFINGKEYQRR